MKFPFNPSAGLIVVNAEIAGPSGEAILRLALDTGDTGSLINAGPLVAIGYQANLTTPQVQITTGSGVEFVPQIDLVKITALGKHQTNFPILCHTLPPSAGVDGLLGLDFFRGQTLRLDFAAGLIELS